jgi:hypothetical protein
MKRTKTIARPAMLVTALMLIALSLAACGGKKESGNNSGISDSPQVVSQSGGSGDAENGTGWPPSPILSKYGLSGMSEPSGMSDIKWESRLTSGYPTLNIEFSGIDGTTNTAIENWFSGNDWREDSRSGYRITYYKDDFTGTFYWEPADFPAWISVVIE